MHPSERQLQELGVAVHGALVALHLLGFFYNLKRGNKFDMVAHGLAALYDGWAVTEHLEAVKSSAERRQT